MFDTLFSYKTPITIMIWTILMLSAVAVHLLPDIIDAKTFLIYQIWIFGIWLFIMILPRKVGSVLDINDMF